MISNQQRRSQSEFWAPIESSIDNKLGIEFSQFKRDQLFAAYQVSSAQQATLVSNDLRQGGDPDGFFRDYVECERFFFHEAAEILGPDDFMTLFRFPADRINEQLTFEHLMEQTAS